MGMCLWFFLSFGHKRVHPCCLNARFSNYELTKNKLRWYPQQPQRFIFTLLRSQALETLLNPLNLTWSFTKDSQNLLQDLLWNLLCYTKASQTFSGAIAIYTVIPSGWTKMIVNDLTVTSLEWWLVRGIIPNGIVSAIFRWVSCFTIQPYIYIGVYIYIHTYVQYSADLKLRISTQAPILEGQNLEYLPTF